MTNTEFELRGFNHVALVSSDMQRTIDFYSGILGMPLLKSLDLPDNLGQHFFFDAGNGNSLAFFWFTEAADGVPGISAPEEKPGFGEWISAVSSLNHVAFDVPAEKFAEYRAKLKAAGVQVGPIVNHDNSPTQVALEMNDDVYVRSFYFQDPDGILLEFATWMREFGPDDVGTKPRTEADRRKPVHA
ncbi:VOC family protein [Nocardioides daejeonensis]|uniref:VOC family protein n=1 Tax=Nocardioides daejeonensis TaxID=1046556 RepID=UPI000D74222F|nr:VOC family protein [Nocardioides daejeonensis]